MTTIVVPSNNAKFDEIQSLIDKNEPVTILGPNMNVDMRFNNQDTDGTKTWRVCIDGNELLVSEIIGIVSFWTNSKTIEGAEKYFISCKPTQIVIINKTATIK